MFIKLNLQPLEPESVGVFYIPEILKCLLCSGTYSLLKGHYLVSIDKNFCFFFMYPLLLHFDEN